MPLPLDYRKPEPEPKRERGVIGRAVDLVGCVGVVVVFVLATWAAVVLVAWVVGGLFMAGRR